MKNKIRITILFIVMSFVVTNLTVSNRKMTSTKSLSSLFCLNQAFAEADGDDPVESIGCTGSEGVYCYNGGCNDAACSITAGISILGCGITPGGSAATTSTDSFACCTLRCKSYSKTDYYESQSVSDTDMP